MSALPFPNPPLADERIRLREHHNGDARTLAEICREQEIQRWTKVSSNYAIEDALRHFERMDREREAGRRLYLVVADVQSDRLLGACDLKISGTDRRTAEIGYMLRAEVRGHRLMPDAVSLLTKWVLRSFQLDRVQIVTHPQNHPAGRVAEKARFELDNGLPVGQQIGQGSADPLVWVLHGRPA